MLIILCYYYPGSLAVSIGPCLDFEAVIGTQVWESLRKVYIGFCAIICCLIGQKQRSNLELNLKERNVRIVCKLCTMQPCER